MGSDTGGVLGNQMCSCLPLAHTRLLFQQLSRRRKRTLFIMVSGDGNPGGGAGREARGWASGDAQGRLTLPDGTVLG